MDDFMTVECTKDPQGFYGLEGYEKGGEYKAEKRPAIGGNGHYWKVSPDGVTHETCSLEVFNKFFVPSKLR